MSERSSDANFDPSNPPTPPGGPELTPERSALPGDTWDAVLTGEEVDVPAGASGNTEELVGIQIASEGTDSSPLPGDAPSATGQDDFLGFSEDVSVADTHFPTGPGISNAGNPAPLAASTSTDESGAASSDGQNVEPVFDEVEDFSEHSSPDSETTQVLRRSLLVGQDNAPPPASTSAPATQTAIPPLPVDSTFEEAMSAPSPDLTDEVETPPSLPGRGLARFLSVILTIIFTPVAWYLVADASARLAFAPDNPMLTGQINAAALAELFAGLIAVAIIALLAAQSSLGLIVTGALVMAVGVPFLFIPQLVNDTGYWGVTNVANWNDFGGNISSHFLTTGFTGIFFALGFLMVALGWVIAAVRRAGRQEEALRLVVATENPDGLKARWARKATQKGQASQ